MYPVALRECVSDVTLDNVDRGILFELQRDARDVTIAEIAEEVDVPHGDFHYLPCGGSGAVGCLRSASRAVTVRAGLFLDWRLLMGDETPRPGRSGVGRGGEDGIFGPIFAAFCDRPVDQLEDVVVDFDHSFLVEFDAGPYLSVLPSDSSTADRSSIPVGSGNTITASRDSVSR
jgi:hypothetical protein